MKESATDEEKAAREVKLAESKPKVSPMVFQLVYSKQFPKASRILVLVRHGQYNLDGTQDSERYLVGPWFILDELYIMIYIFL